MGCSFLFLKSTLKLTHNRYISFVFDSFSIDEFDFNVVDKHRRIHWFALECTIPTHCWIIRWDVCSFEEQFAPAVVHHHFVDVAHAFATKYHEYIVDIISVRRESIWNEDITLFLNE